MSNIANNRNKNYETRRAWRTTPELWEKLQPLARTHRHEPTKAELALWEQLRGRRFKNARFRRQHTIERYIVDFICSEARLIVEVDGGIHQYTQMEDAVRQEFLEGLGYRLIRFTNNEILSSMAVVLERIAEALSDLDSPSPKSERGSGGEVSPP